ncbi:MAG TPA: ATP-grasp domain-containing protein [Ktedonobacteraceae bacterium]
MTRKAHQLGLEVLFVQKTALFEPAYAPYVAHALLLDYEDPAVFVPLARAIFEVLPFAAAFSLLEIGLLPAAQVNDLLGLPGTALPIVRLLKDKWLMRQRLKTAGISPVRASRGSGREDLRDFTRTYGFPCITKPRDSTGSFGVSLVSGPEDIDRVWSAIQTLHLPDFLIEEYIEGRELSVEAFSFHGRHVVVAITEKILLPNFVEIGHVQPASLQVEERAAIETFVTHFLDTLGLQEGPSHTELKVTPGGLRVIESHNRNGGDRIVDLVEITTGVDLMSLAIAWSCGLGQELSRAPTPRAGAAIRFFAPGPGTVVSIQGVEEVREDEHVVQLDLPLQVGDRVVPVRRSADRSGYLVVKAANASEANLISQRLAQSIQIITR